MSDDAFTRAEVLAAHDTAVEAALALVRAPRRVTRRSTDGIHQVDTGGVAVAVFRQHTSRSADPQLHTHALVMAKVQDPTGEWVARRPVPHGPAALHRLGLCRRPALGADRTPRGGLGEVTKGHADIVGVPAELMKV